MDLNRRLPRVQASNFSLVPRADVPRSTFVTTHSLKSTFDAGYLIPIYVGEVLPADVFQGRVTIFARISTLLFPLMDELELETFFFFVPNRLVWTNWKKMMGERANPADSISYTIPQYAPANGTVNTGDNHDYMGLKPGSGYGSEDTFNALPFRGLWLIWNEWFRDQNLQNSLVVPTGDGPDTLGQYAALLLRNKKHDYFTSSLPWPLKGGTEISAPLAGWAPVKGIVYNSAVDPTDGTPGGTYWETTGGSPTSPTSANPSGWAGYFPASTANAIYFRSTSAITASPNVFADLSTATGITINALRLAFQTQRLLERDARSGTRYTELLRAHFGVTPEDARLQRPEYIGGGRTQVQTQAIPQTSATGLTGGTSPLAALGGSATAADQHSFSYNATEHGYIIGLANVRAPLTYQQGVHRLYTRSTRYDIYWPVFAHLGEQIVRNDEIFYDPAQPAQNVAAFGYQERWAEYRHEPSRITGLFRSIAGGNIDEWHLSEQFASIPALNSTFIGDPTRAVLTRALAAGAAANGMQILFDSIFKIKKTRPMPMFSVPGLIDHF